MTDHKNSTNMQKTDSDRAGRARQIVWLVITILIMAVIFIHSAMPADVSSAESDGLAARVAQLLHIGIHQATVLVRKAAHLTEYGVLGIFLILFIRSLKRLGAAPWRCVLIAWLIGAAYAVSDEVHQRFVPGRSGEIRDILIDAAGVAIGIAIVCIVAYKLKK